MLPARLSRFALFTGIFLVCLIIGNSYFHIYDSLPYLPSVKKPDLGGVIPGNQGGNSETVISEPPPPPAESGSKTEQEQPDSHPENDQPWPIQPPGEPSQEGSPDTPPLEPPKVEPTVRPDAPDFDSGINAELRWTEPSFGAHSECHPELDFLRQQIIKLNLTQTVRYTRRTVKPVFPNKVDRDNVTHIPEPLIDHTLVNLNACDDIKQIPSSEIQLQVNSPYPKAMYSQFIFGVATSFDRLNSSLPAFAHWLSGTEAELVVAVTDIWDRSKEDVEALETKFDQAGVNVRLVEPLKPEHSVTQTHFTVIQPMLEGVTKDTKWLGILDDDTFFPSLKPLEDALNKLDHTKDFYVGVLSEDFTAVQRFGLMAFGGGGAYFSMPLAKKLGAHVQQCLDEATSIEGDIIVRDCVYAQSHAKLTQVAGLFQQDIMYDVSGFFEAGVHIINLHHWKSWFHEPVVEQSAVGHICGNCYLQRWTFGKDTVFTNGYSISQYTEGLESIDLSKMEGTWANWDKGWYNFSLGPLRPFQNSTIKLQYKMVAAEDNTKKTTHAQGAKDLLRQLYVRRHDPEKIGEIDEVIELVWGSK